jgi:hypothetical protein
MREQPLVARQARDPLPLLCPGRCEILKASIHGVVLGTAAMCALYNLAAWTARRQRHLAINTGLYTALAAWEWVHVRHHLECLPATRPLEQEESPAA